MAKNIWRMVALGLPVLCLVGGLVFFLRNGTAMPGSESQPPAVSTLAPNKVWCGYLNEDRSNKDNYIVVVGRAAMLQTRLVNRPGFPMALAPQDTVTEAPCKDLGIDLDKVLKGEYPAISEASGFSWPSFSLPAGNDMAKWILALGLVGFGLIVLLLLPIAFYLSSPEHQKKAGQLWYKFLGQVAKIEVSKPTLPRRKLPPLNLRRFVPKRRPVQPPVSPPPPPPTMPVIDPFVAIKAFADGAGERTRTLNWFNKRMKALNISDPQHHQALREYLAAEGLPLWEDNAKRTQTAPVTPPVVPPAPAVVPPANGNGHVAPAAATTVATSVPLPTTRPPSPTPAAAAPPSPAPPDPKEEENARKVVECIIYLRDKLAEALLEARQQQHGNRNGKFPKSELKRQKYGLTELEIEEVYGFLTRNNFVDPKDGMVKRDHTFIIGQFNVEFKPSEALLEEYFKEAVA